MNQTTNEQETTPIHGHQYDEDNGNALALERVENPPPAIRVITPQDARNESIAHTLDAAYAKASTLQLTPEEAKALMADFDDSDIRSGARGDDRLIYLEHAAVRRRLMEVFGPGQWTIINRRSWLDEAGGWLYADIVLLCRGCFVGECIGANRYSAKNARTNYSDAVKGAESDALGRIAGTALGVGLQLWSKGFSDGWMARNRGQQAPQQPRREYPAHTPPPPKPAPQANVERTAATPADVLPKGATEKTRMWAFEQLKQQFGEQFGLTDFLISKGWIADTQDWMDWPLEHVPTSKQSLAALADEIRKTLKSPANPENESQLIVDSGSSELPPEWADVIFTPSPKGVKRADWLATKTTLGMMYRGDNEQRKRLFAFAKGTANMPPWNPEPWIDRDGKKRPVSQEDFDCRVALDLFLSWREERGEKDSAE